MSKTLTFFGVILLVVVVASAALVFLRGDEDTWFCQNGQWVKHGNPSASMPQEPCLGPEEQNIIIETPQSNSLVQSPLEIQGKARGTWFFEASFPVRLIDEQEQLIAVAIATTKGDWMTEEFVPFSALIEFSLSTTTKASLVFMKDNPSGLPENDAQIVVPVVLAPAQETQAVTKVKVFFNSDKLDPEASCNKVFPVNREVAKTQAPARAALEELFLGPTEQEKADGYFTSIPQGVEIQSLLVENKTAKVDFNEALQYQVGGSCLVSAIRAQITETLKQFSSISDVVISINGRTEDILQP